MIKKNKALTDIIGDPDLKLGMENMFPGLGLLCVTHNLSSWSNGSNIFFFLVCTHALAG